MRSPILPCITILLAAHTAQIASADTVVRFLEGAPKDKFIIENTSSCDTGTFELTIDLSGSQAGLIFDTTASGAGVEVYQPLEIAQGQDYAAQTPQIRDGETELGVSLKNLPASKQVIYTIDVDDTQAASDLGQIRVSGAEITGATVRLLQDGTNTEATFDATGVAQIKTNSCMS